MYIVTIENNGIIDTIHGYKRKLHSGKVVKGINTIDSFTFSMLPSNIGFNRIADYKTIVKVFNTNKNRYEFQGRALCTSTEMDDSGLISKEVTSESFLGYLCDSKQLYVEEQNWTVNGLLQHIIDCHNSQVEASKRFTLGTVTVTDPNDNLYCGIQRENTFETIKKKLIEVLGGEIRFRIYNGALVLDYVVELGHTSVTKIALSKNMKSIVREKDPTAFITRLIPLGAKLGDSTEERLTIESVNNGSIYIDDTEAIEAYGIHVGYVEFDDVTDANNLLTKGLAWITENNKVQIKYSITALDLSLLGKEYDDFDIYNKYPIENGLLGIEDTARVIKKNIDVCEETKSTIEIGDNFKTLTELQREQANRLDLSAKTVGKIVADYVTNQKLENRLQYENLFTTSIITQLSSEISMSISGEYVKKTDFGTEMQTAAAELSLSIFKNSDGDIVSAINANADNIHIVSDSFSIQSENFELTAGGNLFVKNANIVGHITAQSLTILDGATVTGLIANEAKTLNASGHVSNGTKTNLFDFDGVAQTYTISSTNNYSSLLSADQLLLQANLGGTVYAVVFGYSGVTYGNKYASWEAIINAANA